MPFTFLAHQAPVLPLKLLRPRWFCGTALAIGTMAPDLPYFFHGDPTGQRFGHSALGQFLYCLPVTMILTYVVRRIIARPLAQRLPELGPLRLRDYAVLADAPTGPLEWLKVAVSALIGSLAHLFLDGITHEGGWAVDAFPLLREPLFGEPLYQRLQYEGSLVLGAIVVGYLWLIGRKRLLVRWTGVRPPRPKEEGRAFLVSSVLAGALAGAVLGWQGHHCPDQALLHRILCSWLMSTSFAFYALTGSCLVLEHVPERAPVPAPLPA